MFPIPLYKKVLSHFFPVVILKKNTHRHEALELSYFQGEWQLGTGSVLYSDGSRYPPLKRALSKLKKQLPEIHKVLMLGSGIGSGLHILARMGYTPQCTLVDIDAQILEWAKVLKPLAFPQGALEFVAEDAAAYIRDSEACYDLIVVDVFEERHVPESIKDISFFQKCRKQITPGGFLIFNLIVSKKQERIAAEQMLQSVFPDMLTERLGENSIMIAQRRAD